LALRNAIKAAARQRQSSPALGWGATIKAKAIAMNSAAAGAVAVFRSSFVRSPCALSVFNGARDIRDLYAIVINQASINFEL
jgi:hypothetical protein